MHSAVVPRCLAIYLQSYFETGCKQPFEQVKDVVKGCSPLPYEFGILWIQLLLAMDRKQLAGEYVRALRDKLKETPLEIKKYHQVLDLLVLEVSDSVQDSISILAKDTIASEDYKADRIQTLEARTKPMEVPEQVHHKTSTTLPNPWPILGIAVSTYLLFYHRKKLLQWFSP